MFTSEDLLSLKYFTVIQADKNHYELQSKNTKHCWKIAHNSNSYFSLLHKHHIEDNYHFQCAYPSLFDIVLDIVNHDEYQLRGRKPMHYHCQNKNSYFDELIKTYGIDG